MDAKVVAYLSIFCLVLLKTLLTEAQIAEDMKSALIFRKIDKQIVTERALISFSNCGKDNSTSQLLSLMANLQVSIEIMSATIKRLQIAIRGKITFFKDFL